MPDPTPTPPERFASILFWLAQAVAAMTSGNRLPNLLIGQITERIRKIKLRVACLIARIDAGTYAPRRSGPRRSPAMRKPWQPSKLPTTYGWLLQLVPQAGAFGSQLQWLLATPDMVELLAAAPSAMRRPIRSLCWMLRIDPPPVLAPPAKPRPPQKTRPAPEPPPQPPPPQPPPPEPPLPAWLRDRRRPWSLARIRGSPRLG